MYLRKYIHSWMSLREIVQITSVHPAEHTNRNRRVEVAHATFQTMTDIQWLREGPHCPLRLPCGLENVDGQSTKD